MSIVYTPGKEMLVADCLSRAQLPDQTESADLVGVIHRVTREVCLSEDNYKFYREIIQKDEKYMRICKYVQTNCPAYHQLDDLSQLFQKCKDELHVENELLFKDHKLVIPTEMQAKMCRWLHAPHLGIEKTLARARQHYFWPGMSEQIRQLVSQCTVCEKFKRNDQKEPLVQETSPAYPFRSISPHNRC